MATDKKTEVKGATGKRYDEAQRKEIVDFYRSQKDENGDITRGAVKATQEKYNISYLSLRRWLEASEGGSKKKAGRPRGSTKKATSEAAPKQRGRKANPSIFVMRQLEKLKSQAERNLNSITKAMEKISAK